MSIKNDYRHTRAACYVGYVCQAAVCVFLPLLFTTFEKDYGISLDKITLLITINFVVQFITDLSAMPLVNRVGYRKSAIIAHLGIFLGFTALGTLPALLENTYAGLVGAVILYSIGGGLLEVLVSPIIESCPSDNKAASMSILHAMFSIGSILVILLSTLFLAVFGRGSWRTLTLLWSVIPLLNMFYFAKVPINEIPDEDKTSPAVLFKSGIFWLFFVGMLCGGASEVGMSQWASAFAESTLGISKAVGDILGPCMFAVMMAASRFIYPVISRKVRLSYYIGVCSAVCVAAYLIAALSPVKFMALAGCGLCGFSVGIMWPGMISLAAKTCKNGGSALFAMLAVAGDLGCTSGPTIIGFVSSVFGGDLKSGLLVGIIFPALLIVTLAVGGRFIRAAGDNA